MEILIRQAGNTVVVEVSGQIDLANSTQLRKVLLREIKENRAARLAVNLSQVGYIDS